MKRVAMFEVATFEESHFLAHCIRAGLALAIGHDTDAADSAAQVLLCVMADQDIAGRIPRRLAGVATKAWPERFDPAVSSPLKLDEWFRL